MAITVTKAFTDFNKEIINLSKERTDKARISRTWLFNQLNGLDSKADLDFPFKYESNNLNFGSFERKTKIRELDYVDLMLCLTANGATYTKFSNILYKINTSNAGKRLKNLSDNDILNSRKMVNKVKNSLSKISQYNSAELHSREEAATLNLISYEWSFDIVPCFYTDNSFYLIPDGQGNWKPSDPRVIQTMITDENQEKKGRLLQLIRTLKYWNRRNSTFTIGSYFFENLVINYSKSKSELCQWIEFDIKSFFSFVSQEIYHITYDPAGYQGNLNIFSSSEKNSISQKAKWAYHKAVEAIKAETEENDMTKAIKLWREIFGNSFPK